MYGNCADKSLKLFLLQSFMARPLLEFVLLLPFITLVLQGIGHFSLGFNRRNLPSFPPPVEVRFFLEEFKTGNNRMTIIPFES